MKKNTIIVLTAMALTTAALLGQPMTEWERNPVTQMNMFGVETVYAAENIKVTLDGNPVSFPDTQPQIVNGRTLVPVRGVFESMGYAVGWFEDTKMVGMESATYPEPGSYSIEIVLGKPSFTVNGVSKALDVPAQEIGGRTLLPLRAISEATGANVTWDEKTRTVAISTNGVQTEKPVTPPEKPADNVKDVPDGAQVAIFDGYTVNKVDVGSTSIYIGESKESVEAKLGTDCIKESASDYDDTKFVYHYADIGVYIKYDGSSKVSEIMLNQAGLSYMGYTIGASYSIDQTLRSYETWSSGMGYTWGGIDCNKKLDNGVRLYYQVYGNTSLTNEPKPTSIGLIVVGLDN